MKSENAIAPVDMQIWEGAMVGLPLDPLLSSQGTKLIRCVSLPANLPSFTFIETYADKQKQTNKEIYKKSQAGHLKSRTDGRGVDALCVIAGLQAAACAHGFVCLCLLNSDRRHKSVEKRLRFDTAKRVGTMFCAEVYARPYVNYGLQVQLRVGTRYSAHVNARVCVL